jgi:hypothetical protein
MHNIEKVAYIDKVEHWKSRDWSATRPQTMIHLTCYPISFRSFFSMLANDDSWAKDLLIDAPHQAHLGEVRCQLDLRAKSRPADSFVPLAISGSAFNVGVIYYSRYY